MNSPTTTLHELLAVIRDRQQNPTARSYTATLLAGGPQQIGGKVLEEAGELVEATVAATDTPGRQHLIQEAADLMYHVLVLLRWADVEWSEVEAELGRRLGIGGLDEKAARAASSSPLADGPRGPEP
jgi:phosphoribosyl-ATP pyrophosphohydrolase